MRQEERSTEEIRKAAPVLRVGVWRTPAKNREHDREASTPKSIAFFIA
jgi:hypothetical protein